MVTVGSRRASPTHAPASEPQLLADLAGEEPAARDAFDTIFRLWYAPLVRVADAIVRDRAVAEELVQDVMLALWRRRDRLDADGSLWFYLSQATRNRALNHVRHVQVERRGAPHAVTDLARDAEAPARLDGEDLASAIRRTLDDLPPRCREVFELSRGRGLRYADIAQQLGVSVKAVEAHMGKALRRLRERLAPWLPPGDAL